jgi:homoserine O-acetyltransferase
VLPSVAKSRQASAFDANNHIRQSEAMMALDVSAAFGGSLEWAAAAVTAKILIIVSTTDHVVTPGPALEFSQALGAEVLQLGSDRGHLAFSCEANNLASTVNAFLAG